MLGIHLEGTLGTHIMLGGVGQVCYTGNDRGLNNPEHAESITLSQYKVETVLLMQWWAIITGSSQ